jgi:uncharacterized protein
MGVSRIVGAVAGLWRFPVKSMRDERLEQAELTERGLVGDHAYALIDADTGKVVSAKSAGLYPDLFGCRAAFIEPPRSGGELPPVRIALPDGASATSDSSDVDRVLSAYFRRNVSWLGPRPMTSPSPSTTPTFRISTQQVTETRSSNRSLARPSSPKPVLLPPARRLVLRPVPGVRSDDVHPRAAERASAPKPLRPAAVPNERDRRRQRGWGRERLDRHEIAIGDAVRLSVALPDPRCAMTTLAQDELPKDTDVLRTLTRHNRVQVGAAGLFPCAGVYAVVEAPGTLQTSDRVALT